MAQSNSLVNCNINFFVQDQLVASGATAQSFINRTFPTMQFPSLTQCVYQGYQFLQSGAGNYQITPTGVFVPVLIIRNASSQNITIGATTTGGNFTLDLAPLGAFVIFNPSTSNIGSVQNVNVGAQNVSQSTPVTFEYLYA